MRTAIVTDSTADIPSEFVEKYSIEVVPNLLMIENQTYLDGEGLSREDFYRYLHTFEHSPTTGAPSIEVYQRVYQRILSEGASSIISLHPSSKFSALFSVASVAAQPFQGRVQVVDSQQVSLGLGFQVIEAAISAAKNVSVNEILECLATLKVRTHVLAVLDSLEYVHRSGRVSWATSALAGIFGLKAIMAVRDGIVQRVGLSYKRKQAVNNLITMLNKLGHLDRLAILHTTILDAGEIDQIIDQAPPTIAPPMIVPITTVIGTHVGPGCLGIAALSSPPV